MELNSDILLAIILVLLIALGGVYFYLKDKLKEVQEIAAQAAKSSAPVMRKTPDDKQKHLFPLKVQAYERIVLFMERIEPSSLVMRLKTNTMKANELHGALLHNIREEYEHNVAQQIYISDNAWNLVKQAKEETIRIVNMAANSMESSATANELTRDIFEKMMVLPQSPSQIALDYLKQEIKKFFN